MHKDTDAGDLLDPRFMEKSYQEAMDLTQAVADYLEMEKSHTSPQQLTADTEVYFASESMRVSTCLMQVMSWFLVQKGVAAGELSRKKAAEIKFRLGSRDVCLADVDTSKGNLPEKLVTYLDKAQNLYRQVARMEEMVYGREDAINPVHDLISQIKDEDISKH